MKYAQAFNAMLQGRRIRRACWSDEMWVAYTPPTTLAGVSQSLVDVIGGEERPAVNRSLQGAAKLLALSEAPEVIQLTDHLDLRRGKPGHLLIGWQPSDVDTQADDWEVLP